MQSISLCARCVFEARFRSVPRDKFGKFGRVAARFSRKSSLLSALSAAGMALFVDRYRPKTLDDLDYHPELSSRLRALVSSPLRPSSLCACLADECRV